MSERDNELLAAPADTPEGHGGGGAASFDIDSANDPEQQPIPADPPDGGGGTGG
jgi:hypothetical protein